LDSGNRSLFRPGFPSLEFRDSRSFNVRFKRQRHLRPAKLLSRGPGRLSDRLSCNGLAVGLRQEGDELRQVTQDGDEEGCLFMAGLPIESEAEAIRDKVGIPKRRELSEEELTRLRKYAVANAFAPQERRSPVLRYPGSENAT
jgi:hypothetical protein